MGRARPPAGRRDDPPARAVAVRAAARRRPRRAERPLEHQPPGPAHGRRVRRVRPRRARRPRGTPSSSRRRTQHAGRRARAGDRPGRLLPRARPRARARAGVRRQLARDLPPDPARPAGRPRSGRDLAVWGQRWGACCPTASSPASTCRTTRCGAPTPRPRSCSTTTGTTCATQGIVSNRVYDALACGALVVSDHLPELAQRFGDAVVTYRTREQLHASVERLLADPGRARASAPRAGRARGARRATPSATASTRCWRPIAPLKTASARPILCS